MTDTRKEMLCHAYNKGDGTLRLVCGVPRELYEAALAEIRCLTKELERAEKSKPDSTPTARQAIEILLGFERDKCSNRAWAGALARTMKIDLDEIYMSLSRKQIQEEEKSR